MSCNSSGSSSICSVDEHIHEILRRKEGRKKGRSSDRFDYK